MGEKKQTSNMNSKKREALAAYGFLLPNLLGFLIFTSIPVVLSMLMAFTHWNIFTKPTWIGLENFSSLLWYHKEGGKVVMNDPFFWQYMYNTVYLMIGIPIGMAGSLITAILMNQKIKGIVVFRTIYFLPTVCSGVALLILWKYLYNDMVGLINKCLRAAGEKIYATPAGGIAFTVVCGILYGLVIVACIAVVLALIQWILEKLNLPWRNKALRVLMIVGAMAAFVLISMRSLGACNAAVNATMYVGGLAAFLWIADVVLHKRGVEWRDGAFRLCVILGALVTTFMIVRSGHGVYHAMNTFMTAPPDWLGTVAWAKPSLMIMGLWGALGGMNMFLYLAALQGVPPSLYEAAEIDGASSWAKFWAVTWPLISPTTFYILIMSIIGGFQSGFMTANVMTGGGPAGSTTTIEYYLYQTAFEKFHMGYASAIAWFLFAIILVLTLVTWRLGGKVVTYE